MITSALRAGATGATGEGATGATGEGPTGADDGMAGGVVGLATDVGVVPLPLVRRRRRRREAACNSEYSRGGKSSTGMSVEAGLIVSNDDSVCACGAACSTGSVFGVSAFAASFTASMVVCAFGCWFSWLWRRRRSLLERPAGAVVAGASLSGVAGTGSDFVAVVAAGASMAEAPVAFAICSAAMLSGRGRAPAGSAGEGATDTGFDETAGRAADAGRSKR